MSNSMALLRVLLWTKQRTVGCRTRRETSSVAQLLIRSLLHGLFFGRNYSIKYEL